MVYCKHMTKQKKKRNKVYAGKDATLARPIITHLSAVNRHPIHQWWYEKKQFAKPILIAAGVAIIVVWLIVGLVRVVSGNAA